MRKKVILFIVFYLLIGNALSWNGNSPNTAANKGFYCFWNTTEKLVAFIGKETFDENNTKPRKQLQTVFLESKEKRVLFTLFWGLFLIGFILLIVLFFTIATLIFVIKNIWFLLVIPLFTLLWEIILFILE